MKVLMAVNLLFGYFIKLTIKSHTNSYIFDVADSRCESGCPVVYPWHLRTFDVARGACGTTLTIPLTNASFSYGRRNDHQKFGLTFK